MQRNSERHPYAILIALTMTLLCGACGFEMQSEALDPAAFRAWCADPEHGVVRKHTANGLTLTMRYQSPEYMTWLQLMRRPGRSERQRDSLLQQFRTAKHFLLTIAPDERHGGGDVTMRGIRSRAEYVERLERLNFELRDYITLKTPSANFAPALTVMEHAQGLRLARTVNLAFVPDDMDDDFYDAETYDVVFNDRIFGTGINHFLFRKKDLDNAPGLEYALRGSD